MTHAIMYIFLFFNQTKYIEKFINLEKYILLWTSCCSFLTLYLSNAHKTSSLELIMLLYKGIKFSSFLTMLYNY